MKRNSYSQAIIRSLSGSAIETRGLGDPQTIMAHIRVHNTAQPAKSPQIRPVAPEGTPQFLLHLALQKPYNHHRSVG